MAVIEELTAADVQQLINEGETVRVEFKIRPPRQAELSERICGMANSKWGGIILFGVEDATGRLVGISKPNAIFDDILKAARLVRPPVPLTTPEPQVFVLGGKNIVAIEIPPNQGIIYQCATKGIVVRRGTHTIQMPIEQIQEQLYSYGLLQWEDRVCLEAKMEDLNTELIEKYLALRTESGLWRLRYSSREELLIALKCAKLDPNGVLRPTNTGLLMFGLYPQLYLPQSEVVIIRYADALGVGKYLDRKNLSGTLTELIDGAADWLRLNVRVGAVIEGFRRIDLPEYPLEALREAVVNAVMHRDYGLGGETVRIFMYSDRIEIRSPGSLLPGITLEELKKMSVSSRPRNLLIAQMMRDIPGYMERVGSGIRLMINQMRELNLPEPEFIDHHDFVVIFRNKTVSPITEPQLQPAASHSDSSSSNPPPPPSTPIPAVAGTPALNERQLKALQIVQQRGSISNGEFREANSVTDRTALRDLAEMVELGLLIEKGKTRNKRYYLP